MIKLSIWTEDEYEDAVVFRKRSPAFVDDNALVEFENMLALCYRYYKHVVLT